MLVEEIKRLIRVYQETGMKDFNENGTLRAVMRFLELHPIFKPLYDDIDELVTFIQTARRLRVIYSRDVDLYQYSLKQLGVTHADSNIVVMFEKIENPEEAFVKLKHYIETSLNKDFRGQSGEFFNVIHGTELPLEFFHDFETSIMSLYGPIFKHIEVQRLKGNYDITMGGLIRVGVTHRQLLTESGLGRILTGMSYKETIIFFNEYLNDIPLRVLNELVIRKVLYASLIDGMRRG